MQTVVTPSSSVSPGQFGASLIQVKNVSKRFGKAEPIVRDLNFEVRPGQIFCLLGPSGSGKSTTMRMLTGVYRPSEGNIRVLGIEPHRFRKRTRAQIGYMPQQFVLFPELTTLENINFVASVYGMNWFGRAKKVREALEFVDLWDARNRLASQLSGGMQRRLELASTLVHHPRLIFVDEPTAGIDPMLRAKFWEHFNRLRDEGRTLFVTTQYVTEADYCDMVAILNKGRLLALGTPEEIRHEAMGGEIINLTLPEVTSQAVRILRRIPTLHRIRTLSTERLQLTVDNAGEILPEIVTAFQQNNLEIVSIEPYHPNFEEVFVQLMEQDEEANVDEEQERTVPNFRLRESDFARPASSNDTPTQPIPTPVRSEGQTEKFDGGVAVPSNNQREEQI
jgi:ABC-2 type transport system ATP-binding protein